MLTVSQEKSLCRDNRHCIRVSHAYLDPIRKRQRRVVSRDGRGWSVRGSEQYVDQLHHPVPSGTTPSTG